MIKKKIIASVLALTTMLVSSNVLAVEKLGAEFDVAEQVAGYIATYYIDDSLNDQDILNLAISQYLKDDEGRLNEFLKSMLSALDPYSEFFTPEEYQAFINNVNQTFYGIGVQIQKKDGYVTVVDFPDGSPSIAAGLQVNDKISKVNGIDMYGKPLDIVRNEIIGKLGTSVDVTVLRGTEEFTFTIIRAEVSSATVSYKKISDDVAYISIVDMSDDTSAEFQEALLKADADGITDIILDLRNNGGGYVSCAVDIAKMIVPEGVIVDTVYRQGFMDKTFYSDLKNPKYDFSVLVNGYTASAAEILASAIQDSGVGKLIGEQSFGKGIIQSSFSLSNGAVIKMTVGHYETRNGTEIHEIGLKPDIEVSNNRIPIDTKKYTKFSYNTKWKVGDIDDNIKAAKERLYLLSYYNGAIDNVFDKALEEAIKSFQANNEIYPYGVLDLTTQTTIENVFSEIEIEMDTQLETAYENITGEKLDLTELEE